MSPSRGRILSVGYQHLTARQFARIAAHVDYIVDTRSSPLSRKPGWSGRALAEKFGEKYVWEGALLGGRGTAVRPAGLRKLRALNEQGKRLLLLCLEEAPGDCHRHAMIARRLLPDINVLHIWQNEVVTASELERSLLENDAYNYDLLSSILKRLGRRS